MSSSTQTKVLFEYQGKALKKRKLDSTWAFQDTNQKVNETYVIALEIGKQENKTIGETWIKPCSLQIVEIVLGNGLVIKLAAVSLSNNTVQRRINNMAIDTKDQVVQEIKSATFSISMWHCVPSCWYLQGMFTQVHLKKSFSFVLLLN